MCMRARIPLLTQEIDAGLDGAPRGHVHRHGPDLRVPELHQRLDLPPRRHRFCSAHIQAKSPTFPDGGLADEAHALVLRAVDVDDDDLLGGLGWRVAPLDHLAQRHRLVRSDEGVEDVGAPARAVLHQQLLGWVLALHEAVEDAHPVGEGRAADLDDAGIQTKEHSAFQDGEANVVGDDDAAAALQHVLDSLLQQRRFCETSNQEEELNVTHFWLLKQLSWRRRTRDKAETADPVRKEGRVQQEGPGSS